MMRTKRSGKNIRVKLIIIAFIFMICICAVAAWFILVQPFAPTRAYTKQAQALVRNIETRRDQKTGMFLYYPVYELFVNGTKLTLHSSVGYTFNPFRIGEQVALSYDPVNPYHFALSSEMGMSWTELIGGLFCISLSAISLLLFVRWLVLHHSELNSVTESINSDVFDLSDMGGRNPATESVQRLSESVALSENETEKKQESVSSAIETQNSGGAGLSSSSIHNNEILRRDFIYQDEYITEAVTAALRLYADNNHWTEGFMTTTGKASLFVPFKQGITNGAVFTSVEFDGGRTLYVDIYPRSSVEKQIDIDGFGIRQEQCTKLVMKLLADLDRLESISLADDYALSVDLSD